MPVYIGAGRIFSTKEQATRAAVEAGGDEDDVESFADYFDAEEYLSRRPEPVARPSYATRSAAIQDVRSRVHETIPVVKTSKTRE